MNKEELLEKSRKENKNANLADTEVTNKGAIWSACVMAILSLVFYAAETMVTGKTNSAFFRNWSTTMASATFYCAHIFNFFRINHVSSFFIDKIISY